MKISNETKIGAIAVAAIAVLFLGYNFLRGKDLFGNQFTLLGKYANIQGLQTANPIIINGMQVGSVYKITADKNMSRIMVEFTIDKDINIPANSIALIKNNPLGTPSVDIKLGDGNVMLKDKDTIITDASGGVFDEMLKKVDPVLYEVRKAVGSIDTLVNNLNTTLDPAAKNNIGASLENMNQVTRQLILTTASLNAMLNQQNGALAKTLNNMSSVTGNLAGQNEKIANMVSNLDKTTTNISQLDLQHTLSNLDATISDLKNTIGKISSNEGSLGMLMNDTRLYNNLASTGNKLNLLLDDLRTNPKRYVNISVFGKKNTSKPLMVPLPDTLHAPYYIEKIKVEPLQ